jgi:hypothetical protein
MGRYGEGMYVSSEIAEPLRYLSLVSFARVVPPHHHMIHDAFISAA